MEDKKYCKFRGHCHYTEEYRCATHSIFNLKYSVPKKLFIVFDSGSNYDFHFVIKELAEELKKKQLVQEKIQKYTLLLQFQ